MRLLGVFLEVRRFRASNSKKRWDGVIVQYSVLCMEDGYQQMWTDGKRVTCIFVGGCVVEGKTMCGRAAGGWRLWLKY